MHIINNQKIIKITLVGDPYLGWIKEIEKKHNDIKQKFLKNLTNPLLTISEVYYIAFLAKEERNKGKEDMYYYGVLYGKYTLELMKKFNEYMEYYLIGKSKYIAAAPKCPEIEKQFIPIYTFNQNNEIKIS